MECSYQKFFRCYPLTRNGKFKKNTFLYELSFFVIDNENEKFPLSRKGKRKLTALDAFSILYKSILLICI